MEYDFYGCIERKGDNLFLQKSLTEIARSLSYEHRRYFDALMYDAEYDNLDYAAVISYLDAVGAYYYEHGMYENWVGYVRLVDSFFSNYMFPLEFTGSAWMENIFVILYILKRVSRFINSKVIWNYVDEQKDINLIEYRRLFQNNHVYFLVAYNYLEDRKHFNEVLGLIHCETLSNVRRLVSDPEYDSLWKSTVMIDKDICIGTHEYWQEPFSWVIHEAESGEYAHAIIDTYNQYLQDLYKEHTHCNVGVLSEIIEQTEKNLRNMCEQCINESESSIADLEDKLLINIAERDQYAILLRKSEERTFYTSTTLSNLFEEKKLQGDDNYGKTLGRTDKQSFRGNNQS